MIGELAILIATCVSGPDATKTLEVQPIGPDSIRFRIEVLEPNCDGEVEGTAGRVGPNHFRWHAQNGCTELIIRMGPIGIQVEEPNPCFDLHGVNCNFAGAYRTQEIKKLTYRTD